MTCLYLTSEKQFINKNETRLYFYYSVKETDNMHTHDFHEIFYVFGGSAVHRINGKSIVISEGDLVFMRNHDTHCYGFDGKNDFKFVNLSFKSIVLNDLIAFFKHSRYIDNFLKDPMPYTVKLDSIERGKIMMSFKKFNTLPRNNPELRKIQIRMLLSDIFYKYLIEYQSGNNKRTKEADTPKWFKNFYVSLSDKDVFTSESDIIALSGKSREHTSRLFKKVTGKTIHEYIIEQRLNYACNLFEQSDMSILDIALECGFQDLSTFYHLFKKSLGVSPKKFKDQKNIVLYEDSL